MSKIYSGICKYSCILDVKEFERKLGEKFDKVEPVISDSYVLYKDGVECMINGPMTMSSFERADSSDLCDSYAMGVVADIIRDINGSIFAWSCNDIKLLEDLNKTELMSLGRAIIRIFKFLEGNMNKEKINYGAMQRYMLGLRKIIHGEALPTDTTDRGFGIDTFRFSRIIDRDGISHLIVSQSDKFKVLNSIENHLNTQLSVQSEGDIIREKHLINKVFSHINWKEEKPVLDGYFIMSVISTLMEADEIGMVTCFNRYVHSR